jgi:hypothetical protein
MTDFGSLPKGLLEGLAASIGDGKMRTRRAHCLNKSGLHGCRQYLPTRKTVNSYEYRSLARPGSGIEIVLHEYFCRGLPVRSANVLYTAAWRGLPMSFQIASDEQAVGWICSELDSLVLKEKKAGKIKESSQWRG